jgi:hypothetical protein
MELAREQREKELIQQHEGEMLSMQSSLKRMEYELA